MCGIFIYLHLGLFFSFGSFGCNKTTCKNQWFFQFLDVAAALDPRVCLCDPGPEKPMVVCSNTGRNLNMKSQELHFLKCPNLDRPKKKQIPGD